MNVPHAQAVTLQAWQRRDPQLFAQAVNIVRRRRQGFGDAAAPSVFDDIMGTLTSAYATVKGANTASQVAASQAAANAGQVNVPFSLASINWPLWGGLAALGVLGFVLLRGRGKRNR